MSAFARLAIITLNTRPMKSHAPQGEDFGDTHSESNECSEHPRSGMTEKNGAPSRFFARVRVAFASWL